VLRGGEADKPIKLMTKVTTGMQIPLNFAIPRQQSTTTGGGK
jgi:hypothetical protein